jgi:hypothetical protein
MFRLVEKQQLMEKRYPSNAMNHAYKTECKRAKDMES